MDLSKAFDCLEYEVLIAKLHAYGLNRRALKLIHNCLDEQKHRVRINGGFSEWKWSRNGVLQG